LSSKTIILDSKRVFFMRKIWSSSSLVFLRNNTHSEVTAIGILNYSIYEESCVTDMATS